MVLFLSEWARGRFQRVIDRQFFREKYKFDRAMQKMNLAVGSLIDRLTLGRRLLEAAAEVLRLEWGALYLGDASGRSFQLVAAHGPSPEERWLWLPIIRWWPGCGARRRCGFRTGWRSTAHPTRPSDAMIALGRRGRGGAGRRRPSGRAAGAGPQAQRHAVTKTKRWRFLGALSSVATLVLHSADIQQTLESFNQELRRQGRQDRRAAAANLDPARSAQGSGRARARAHRPPAARGGA